MVHECVCGTLIKISDELCEDCLEYCAKVLDVDVDTYQFNSTGQPALFEIYRYAWNNAEELRNNHSQLMWSYFNDVLTFNEEML